MPAREIRSSETILIEKRSKSSKMLGLRNLNGVCETQRILQGLWRISNCWQRQEPTRTESVASVSQIFG